MKFHLRVGERLNVLYVVPDHRHRPFIAAGEMVVDKVVEPPQRGVTLRLFDEVAIDEQDDLAPELPLIDRFDDRPLAAPGLGHRVLDAIEVRHLLRLAVFFDLEVVSGQPGDRPTMAVCDRHVDGNNRDIDLFDERRRRGRSGAWPRRW